MRDGERKKKERRREAEKIKTKIQPSQLQTTIIFDRKIRLMHDMVTKSLRRDQHG
jgi:hypothetical protein